MFYFDKMGHRICIGFFHCQMSIQVDIYDILVLRRKAACETDEKLTHHMYVFPRMKKMYYVEKFRITLKYLILEQAIAIIIFANSINHDYQMFF